MTEEEVPADAIAFPLMQLARIAEAHHKWAGPAAGMVADKCAECGAVWPCPTYVWATQNRPGYAAWDPADDEEEE